MTQPNHVHRTHVRGVLAGLALALVCLAPAHAATYNKNTGAHFGSQTSSMATASWRHAPGAPRSFSTSGGKPVVTTPVAGSSWNQFMANARAMAEPAELARSMATGRGLGAAVTLIGVPVLATLIDSACLNIFGGQLVQGAQWQECKYKQETLTEYHATQENQGAPGNWAWVATKAGAASAWAEVLTQDGVGGCGAYTDTGIWQPGNQVYTVEQVEPYPIARRTCSVGGSTGTVTGKYWTRSQSQQVRDGWQPTTPDLAQQKLTELIKKYCDDGDVRCHEAMQSIVEVGMDVEVGPLVVTGPASTNPVTQQSTTTRTVTNPDGTTTQLQITTTTTTHYTYNYEGDKVTRTENRTTTTVTYNPQTGESTTETVTEGKPTPPGTDTKTPEQEQEEKCPPGTDLVSCSRLDAPSLDVPEKEVNISWTPDNLGFGGGSCPPPITFSTYTGAYSVPFTSLCNIISSVIRPLLLLMATLAAYFIILPRET